jgi:hypothetical protein
MLIMEDLQILVLQDPQDPPDLRVHRDVDVTTRIETETENTNTGDAIVIAILVTVLKGLL